MGRPSQIRLSQLIQARRAGRGLGGLTKAGAQYDARRRREWAEAGHPEDDYQPCALSRAGWQQLINEPRRGFLAPGTYAAIADVLDVPAIAVLVANAASVGLDLGVDLDQLDELLGPIVVTEAPAALVLDTCDRVIADLRAGLAEGRWGGPGDKMPGRNPLAKELGAAPSTVQKAVKILAEAGELDIAHGSGTYIPARRALRVVDRTG